MARAATLTAVLRRLPIVAGVVLSPVTSAQEAPSRGRLLYDTHCVACHNEQVHWRDKGQVTNWETLVEQVRIWQARARLGWDDADIREVSRFLNDAVYRLPSPRARG